MLTVTANTRIEAMSVKIVPPTTISTVGPCAKPNLWRMVKRRERRVGWFMVGQDHELC